MSGELNSDTMGPERPVHPFTKPAGMNEKLLLPLNTGDGCSNDTLIRLGGTDESGRFLARLNSPCDPTSLSPKSQLVALVHAFYSDAGIRTCSNRQCEKLKAECHKILPVCRWEPFRECIVTLVSCHVRALRDPDIR